MENKNFSKAEKELYEMVVKSLEEGVAPWQKPWSVPSSPKNALSNLEYRGINLFYLSLVMISKGYTDSRFMTFKQMVAFNKSVDEENRINLPKGTRGYGVEFFSIYHRELKRNISFIEFNAYTANEQRKLLEDQIVYFNKKSSTVFNIEQFKGKFPKIHQEAKLIDPDVDMIKGVADEMSLKLNISSNNLEAYYAPSQDTVHLPDERLFRTEEGFYKTVFHEYAHATGHSTRLNREMAGRSNLKAYAEEELRAEFASLFLSQKVNLQIEKEIKQSSAYIDGWLIPIKDDPNILFNCAKDASKISDYLYDKVLDYGKHMRRVQINKIDEKLQGLKSTVDLVDRLKLSVEILNAMQEFESIKLPEEKTNGKSAREIEQFINLKDLFATEIADFFRSELYYETVDIYGLDYEGVLDDVKRTLSNGEYDVGVEFFNQFLEEIEVGDFEMDL